MLKHLTALVYTKTIIHPSVGGYTPRRFVASVKSTISHLHFVVIYFFIKVVSHTRAVSLKKKKKRLVLIFLCFILRNKPEPQRHGLY